MPAEVCAHPDVREYVGSDGRADLTCEVCGVVLFGWQAVEVDA